MWSLSGQQHNSNSEAYSWAMVNLSDYTGLIQIRFRAVAAGGPRGDIAIDNIAVFGRILYGDANLDNIVDTDDLFTFENTGSGINVTGFGRRLFNYLYEFAEFAYYCSSFLSIKTEKERFLVMRFTTKLWFV